LPIELATVRGLHAYVSSTTIPSDPANKFPGAEQAKPNPREIEFKKSAASLEERPRLRLWV
jgi:hypothetical protein